MEISVSELLAFFSVIVAALAYRHSVESSNASSKQIQEISNNYLRMTSNIALNQASQKYVLLLKEVNDEFEGIVNKISSHALEGSMNIGNIFDSIDTNAMSHPHLRHAFHECITTVRNAYDRELTYQTGLNLMSRIRFLKYIKNDVVSYSKSKVGKSLFTFFKKSTKNKTPEEIINTSTQFWESLKIIYERTPLNSEPELFRKVSECVSEYSKLHKEVRCNLESLEKKLEDAVKENELETFDIRENAGLGYKLYQVKGDIGRYRELYFPDLHGLDDVPVHEGVAYSIYIGSVLYVASQYHAWGRSISI